MSIGNLGFLNLLGNDGGGGRSCTFNSQLFGQSTINFQVDGQNHITGISGMTGAQFADLCQRQGLSVGVAECKTVQQWDANGGQCASFLHAALNDYYTLVSQATESVKSGVYEYWPLFVAIGGICIVLVIISAGITLAKRSVNAVTEETSADDDLEYYEGPDGREYWRIKPWRRGEQS